MTDKKKTSLNLITRIILFLSGVALFIVLIVPIWKIELTAPQYPEGLEMFIHADKLSGDIDIINGLNNYIGMKQIHENELDRKSTRLNSSHVAISYAVFCLKK